MSSGDARGARSKVPRPLGGQAPAAPAARRPPPPKPRRVEEPPRSALDPSVLVVGADEIFLPALKVALARHKVHVETASLAQAVETVVVAAPDLILLAGEAARAEGQALLEKLTSSPVSSVIPVVILGDEHALSARLKAFRHGATAVIPRTASVDAVAEAISRLAREIPERGGEALGEVGEATLEEFVATLTNELRSGILSVQSADEKAPVRLVLGGGRPLAAFIDEFVKRARAHVLRAEPLRYEFDDRAGGTVQLLPAEGADSEPPPANVRKLRVLLADDGPARLDVVAQELRSRGAEVGVCSLTPSEAELRRLRELDPEVVVVGEREIEGSGYALLRRMKRDTRLRWASLLVVRWNEIVEPALGVPLVDRLTGPLATLAEADRALTDRAELGDAFDSRLEVNGPARCLRALAASGRALRVTITNPRLKAELDVSDHLLVGASAETPSGQRWEGAQALSALLVLSTGRVHVEPALQPVTTNLMSEVDAALNLAEREPAPIAPSLPAGERPSLAPAEPIPRAPALPRDLPGPEPAATPASQAFDASAAATPIPGLPLQLASAPSPPAVPPPENARPSSTSVLPRSALGRPHWRRTGISPSLAALFVGIAVVQGLLGAGLYKLLNRSGRSGAHASASAAASAPQSAEPRAAAASVVAAVAPPSAVAANPRAVPAVPASAAAAEAPVAPVNSPGSNTGRDEAGKPAPSCDELLADVPASAANPGAAFEQLKLARHALVQGKVDDAQRAYCKAVRWDPQNANYYFELAQLLLIRRDGGAAAEWATRGVRLDPSSTRGQSLIGDGLARVGDAEGARRAWFAASKLNDPKPSDIEQLVTLDLREADGALAARDTMRAERFYRRAAILGGENSVAERGLATALLRIGEPTSALRWARLSAEHAPRDPLAQLALGDALLATNDGAAARAAWQKAVELGYPDARRRIQLLDSKR